MSDSTAAEYLFGMEIIKSKHIPDGIMVVANLDKCADAILKGESVREHIAIIDMREGVDDE